MKKEAVSESRTGRRYDVRLPIRIDGPAGVRRGITRDVSASGVFIQADPALRMGAHVHFNITLPRELLATPGDVQVACHGRVVRVEREGGGKGKRTGLACVIDSYKFVRAKAAAAARGRSK